MNESQRAALSVAVTNATRAAPEPVAPEPPHQHGPLFERSIVRRALWESFSKLDPRRMIRNPVMFVVEVGSAFTSVLCLHALFSGRGEAPAGFIMGISAWLWLTVLFANFAEAMAEGRGKAQADSLRNARQTVLARRLREPRHDVESEEVDAGELRKGDLVLIRAGELVPSDGEIIDGVASVDESAITGESAPVIRESGGDRSAVTGGTRVLSDWLLVRVTHNPGETFLDRMIAMVEGAKRKKTPNEIALDILLAGLSIVLLLATVTLYPYSRYAVAVSGQGSVVSMTVLVALLVCLIPTTIGGLLSAIGIAGMDRMIQANVVATSGRAVEASGDVDVLLLDKTGTITLGNRQAAAFIPADDVSSRTLADAAQLASLADETPEGRSIVVLAKTQFDLRGREIERAGATFVAFSAQTRMSGVDLPGRQVRKGALDAIARFVREHGGQVPDALRRAVEDLARQGSTPLVVADNQRVLGVVELRDVVKGGIKEKFAELRRMGIKTVMITGDNPLTAAAIAAEAGVDDFLAEATPEQKLACIRDYQAKGHLVAMTGDGTNDAPALAQADVAVAMNTGTQAAKEAGNMVDLDSNPTKLIQIVEIGKQMLMTRGALTTFSIANDLAKYFAIIPAAFAATYPALGALNLMRLHSPTSAVMSAVIFNALIIVGLIPLALRGIRYRAASASRLLRQNLLFYGVGGVILPLPLYQGDRHVVGPTAPGLRSTHHVRPAPHAGAARVLHGSHRRRLPRADHRRGTSHVSRASQRQSAPRRSGRARLASDRTAVCRTRILLVTPVRHQRPTVRRRGFVGQQPRPAQPGAVLRHPDACRGLARG
jgi:K+-transporting ATPase ATPase B chain